MLWLAGLMGIVGAGAASITYFPTTPEVEDDELPQNSTEEEHGDLFDHMNSTASLETPPDPVLEALAGPFEEPQAASEDAYGVDVWAHQTKEDLYEEAAKTAFDSIDPFLTGEWMPLHDPDAPSHMPFLLTEMLDGTGETTQDTFAMGDWVTKGEPAEVLDYDFDKDRLLLVWDDLAGTPKEPEVRVESDPYDPEVKHVMMNDYSVAEVYGDPNLNTGDITMIPLSSALIVGLEPA
jgi:hypothetical protein